KRNLDSIIVHNQPINQSIKQRYADEDAEPVIYDLEKLKELDLKIIERDIIEPNQDMLRHDKKKIANKLYEMEFDTKATLKTEITTLIRMNYELSIGNNTLTLDIQTENVAIARRIYILIKETYDYKIEILVRKNMRLKKNNIYIIRLKEKVIELLSQLDLKTSDEYITQTIKPTTITLNCCKRAYLRGAFLARGSINNPETSSYHLEIFNFDQTHSIEILELMNYFDLNAREIKRRNGFVVYLKEAEKITEFLSIIGAHNALFKFEDVRIVRDMRNSVNRLVNCETANMNKTISASVKQVENIKYIKE